MQWLGFEHPDPENEQLKTLQRFLQRGMDGKVDRIAFDAQGTFEMRGAGGMVTGDELARALPHMWLWMDFVSVPQVCSADSKKQLAKPGVEVCDEIREEVCEADSADGNVDIPTSSN